MTPGRIRVQIGTEIVYQGQLVTVVGLHLGGPVADALLRSADGELLRVGLAELAVHACAGPEHARGEDATPPISRPLSNLTSDESAELQRRVAAVREVLTGYSSGSAANALPGEPRPQYTVDQPKMARYSAMAAEMHVSVRTISSWVSRFNCAGPAGLAPHRRQSLQSEIASRAADSRWIEMAIEVMAEYLGEVTPTQSGVSEASPSPTRRRHREKQLSRPTQQLVIRQVNARLDARFGPGSVTPPPRSTAYKILANLNRKHRVFDLSTRRTRDIADRPKHPYRRLHPSRPGHYVLIDTTRLDTFGLDSLTGKWVQCELTVAMDWYSRCIVGLTLTPVSTNAQDASQVLFECFRPRQAPDHWPERATWPAHGLPQIILHDVGETPAPTHDRTGSPPVTIDSIVIDHGKIFTSEHFTSLCQHLGISIQPARLRTGSDKGPIERFFGTIRTGLLQCLPGYKGPDLGARGESPEEDAVFTLSQLEDMIREWIATEYHLRTHSELCDPHLPGVLLSPAEMYQHGIARSGLIDLPADPDFHYQFFPTIWRTLQSQGVEYQRRIYSGILPAHAGAMSGYSGKHPGKWPFHVNSNDIRQIFYQHPISKDWIALDWIHADELAGPLSEEGLDFARGLAIEKYGKNIDDVHALDTLFDRWGIGLGTDRRERRIAMRQIRESNLAVQSPLNQLRNQSNSNTDSDSDSDSDTTARNLDQCASSGQCTPSTEPDEYYSDTWEDA